MTWGRRRVASAAGGVCSGGGGRFGLVFRLVFAEFGACGLDFGRRGGGDATILCRRLCRGERCGSYSLHLLNCGFGVVGDGRSIDLDLTTDGVLPAVRTGLVFVVCAAAGVAAGGSEVGGFVLTDFGVALFELVDLGLFFGGTLGSGRVSLGGSAEFDAVGDGIGGLRCRRFAGAVDGVGARRARGARWCAWAGEVGGGCSEERVDGHGDTPVPGAIGGIGGEWRSLRKSPARGVGRFAREAYGPIMRATGLVKVNAGSSGQEVVMPGTESFWKRVQNMFTAKPARSEEPDDIGEGPETPEGDGTGLDLASGKESAWRWRSGPAMRDLAQRMVDLADNMQQYIDKQDQRAADFGGALERVCTTLEQLAEAQRAQGQTLQAIANQTEATGKHTAGLADTVGRIPESLLSQAEAVRTVAQQLEANQQTDAQLMQSLQTFGRAVDALGSAGNAQIESLQKLNATQSEHQEAFATLVREQGQRFMWIIVIAAVLGIASIAALIVALALQMSG